MRKFIITALYTFLLTVSLGANAALVDNGSFVTDNVAGLNWLKVDATWDKTYQQALDDNPDWRHATNDEVENLFDILFGGYVANDGFSDSSSSPNPAYLEQDDDVDAFQSLFGERPGASGSILSIALYQDENSILRHMGSRQIPSTGNTQIYGLNYPTSYTANSKNESIAVYLVQDAPPVPVPAAVWLFGSGLIGLIGVARRKKS